jgi:processive 1,2-diacylglycerol beta-glucosyltransferase
MKILIASASVGAGHVRAAEAVELALRQTGAPLEIRNDDVLSFTPKAFRKVYRDAYFQMVARSPQVVGWLYHATDKPFHKDVVQRKVEQANTLQFVKATRAFDADVAICTHFLPTALLDRERRHGRFRGRIVTVVTDFEVHGMWLSVPSDHYFVATDEARAYLEALGIDAAKITVSGIPTHPVFQQQKDRLEMRRKHGLREDVPVVLVSAGGFGVASAEPMLRTLAGAGLRAQIVAVCGKSSELKAVADGLAGVKAIGFTTDMDELMTAADLMVGKPGGLTTSESLIKGLGWAVVNPIPGQEERNTIFLLEQGIGVWIDNPFTLAYKVRAVLETPGRLDAMRRNALALGRPDAGRTIAQAVIG